LAKISFKQLTTVDLVEWRDLRLTENVLPSTVRRELQLIGAVLSVARREWKWLSADLMKDLQYPKKSQPRERRISSEETEKVL